MNNLVNAKQSRARISPKKVAPVLDIVRGMNLTQAKLTLILDRSKASKIVLKLVKSAESNAKNLKGVKIDDLIVKDIWVGGGPVFKSGQFVGRGRFNPILKRTSNIYVGLDKRSSK